MLATAATTRKPNYRFQNDLIAIIANHMLWEKVFERRSQPLDKHNGGLVDLHYIRGSQLCHMKLLYKKRQIENARDLTQST